MQIHAIDQMNLEYFICLVNNWVGGVLLGLLGLSVVIYLVWFKDK